MLKFLQKLFSFFGKKQYVYVLRNCSKKMTSHKGFKWPKSGMVECSDFDPSPEAVGGLHGWLNGDGDFRNSPYSDIHKDVWLVVKVLKSDIVHMEDRVKYPKGEVVFSGIFPDSIRFLEKYKEPTETHIGKISSSMVKGSTIYYDSAFCHTTTGELGYSGVGDNSTAISGRRGFSYSGDLGVSITGEYGSAVVSYRGLASGGEGASLTFQDKTAGKLYRDVPYANLEEIVGKDCKCKPNVLYTVNRVGEVVKYLPNKDEIGYPFDTSI